MAEAFSIAAAAISLLPLCREGFSMVKSVFEASETASEIAQRVQSQIYVYDAWRRAWDTPSEAFGKFRDYERQDRHSAESVRHELMLLSYTLCNTERLLKDYGLRSDWHSVPNPLSERVTLTESSFRNYLDRCRQNLSFLNKCKFVVTGADRRADVLIDRLRERNEVLRTYVYMPWHQQVIQNRLFEVFAHGQPATALEQLYREETRALRDGQRDVLPYKDMALTGMFSNAVKDRYHRGNARRFVLSDFITNPAYGVSASQSAEMAVIDQCPPSRQRRLLYIEWTEFTDSRGQITKRKNADRTARMLSASKTEMLLLPYCYGFVEDERNGRYGLVLQPPEHVRTHIPRMWTRGFISERRKPVSLKLLLEELSDKPDLGHRFDLAKKLMNAVHKMHCADWIHKNIRPSSIMFFPRKDSFNPSSSTRPGDPVVFDLRNPMFVGFGRARVDPVDDERDRYWVGDPTAMNIELDEYQHPHKLKDPQIVFSRYFDLYSLGCTLLEIGYWCPLRDLVDIPETLSPRRIDKRRDEIWRKTLEMKGLTGSIYADVVAMCVGANPTGQTLEADRIACSEFLSEIMWKLGRCSA